MSDERLRAIERRWQETGAPDDLEALMNELARAGDVRGAVAAGNALLIQDTERTNARNTMAEYAPLHWTGTVGFYFGPPKTSKEKNPWFLSVEERGNRAYEVPLESFEVMKKAHLVDIAYAGNCLTLLVEEIVGPLVAKYSRIDITPTTQTTREIPDSHTVYDCTLHTDHTRGITDVVHVSTPTDLPIHTSEQLPRIYSERDNADALRRIYLGNDATITGDTGITPWMHEDGNVYSADLQTHLFRHNGGELANLKGRGYGSTRVPVNSRMARGENSAQSDAHLASVFDGPSGLQRVIVEVPITILNVLRGMR